MKDRILDKVIRFDVLLGIVALVIALVAAFFSVYGIATLFAGAFVSTAIMASVLEVGKLVSVTYLYRYWTQTKRWLRTYLSMALVVLMIITSMGIFGYLSSAYQKSSTAYKGQQEQIVLVEKTKTYAQNKIDQAQNRILVLNEMRKAQEARLSEALTNTFISRNTVALRQLQDQTTEMIKTTEADTKAEQNKIESGITEVKAIDQKVNEMRYNDKSKDIRTFEFVAKLFNTSLDNVAKWFIFLLIVVFDPLAVALILAYNVVVYKNPDGLTNSNNSEKLPLVNPVVEEVPEFIVNNEEDKKKVVRPPTSFKFHQQKIPKLPDPEPVPEVPPASTPLAMTPDMEAFRQGYFKSY